MGGIQTFYREASPCLRVDGELSKSFPIGVGERQVCVTLAWLFNIFMDGCRREMKAKVGNVDARLKMYGMGWVVVACLFVE